MCQFKIQLNNLFFKTKTNFSGGFVSMKWISVNFFIFNDKKLLVVFPAYFEYS